MIRREGWSPRAKKRGKRAAHGLVKGVLGLLEAPPGARTGSRRQILARPHGSIKTIRDSVAVDGARQAPWSCRGCVDQGSRKSCRAVFRRAHHLERSRARQMEACRDMAPQTERRFAIGMRRRSGRYRPRQTIDGRMRKRVESARGCQVASPRQSLKRRDERTIAGWTSPCGLSPGSQTRHYRRPRHA